MPKWKKGETEFTVGVSYHEVRGYQSSIPRPVIEHLGKHESILQHGITFRIKGKRVEVVHEPKSKAEMTTVNTKKKPAKMTAT